MGEYALRYVFEIAFNIHIRKKRAYTAPARLFWFPPIVRFILEVIHIPPPIHPPTRKKCVG